MRKPPASLTFAIVLSALVVVIGAFSIIAMVAPWAAAVAGLGLVGICGLVVYGTRGV